MYIRDYQYLLLVPHKVFLFYSQLIYQRFYSTLSADDKCTLFADRNAINRRNVKADAHHAYAPNKQMFVLAVKARIVAAAMLILGLKDVDGNPTEYRYPNNASKTDKTSKRIYLRNLASQVVRLFIVDEKAYNSIIDQALQDADNQRAREAEMTPDGLFPADTVDVTSLSDMMVNIVVGMSRASITCLLMIPLPTKVVSLQNYPVI